MTTATEACAAIRSLMEANIPLSPKDNSPIPYRWRGEPSPPLPDTPAPFIYTVFATARSSTIERGGGVGRNRHRNPGEIDIFVFIPNDWGEQYGTDIAEHFAALLRPYRANGVTVEDATVYPGGAGSEIAVPGMDNAADSYFWCGCGASFYFDLIG